MEDIKKESKNNNIFDLTKLIPIDKEEEIKKNYAVITEADREKLLTGYIEVEESDWGSIAMNSHVRYLRKDGAFRRGGYVKGHWIGTYGPKQGKNCIQMINNLSGYKPTTWNICIADIASIWIREDAPKNLYNIDSSTTTNEQSESVEFLTNQVGQLKIDMTRMNNEQKRIINLIKKLHGIKSRT